MNSIPLSLAALAAALSLLSTAPAQALTIDLGTHRVELDDPAGVSRVQNTGQGVVFSFAPSWSAGVAATAATPSVSSSHALPGFSITANDGYSIAFTELGLAASGAWSYVPYGGTTEAGGVAASSASVAWQGAIAGGPEIALTGWQQSFSGGPASGQWSVHDSVALIGHADTLAFTAVPALTLSAFSGGGIPVLSAYSDRGLEVTVDFVVSQVPEPQAWVLMGLGLLPIIALRRRRLGLR